MIRLAEMLTSDRVVLLDETDKDSVLKRMVSVLARSAEVHDEADLLDAIRGRELIMSTGIGFGIAVPHAKISTVDNVTLAVGISTDGIPFESLDDQPVHIVVMIASGAEQQDQYIRTLARVMLVLKNAATRHELTAAGDVSSVLDILSRY